MELQAVDADRNDRGIGPVGDHAGAVVDLHQRSGQGNAAFRKHRQTAAAAHRFDHGANRHRTAGIDREDVDHVFQEPESPGLLGVDREHQVAGQEGRHQAAVEERLMIDDQDGSFAGLGEIVQSGDSGFVEQPEIPPEQRPEGGLRQQADDPQCDGQVDHRGNPQHVWRRYPGGGEGSDEAGTQHHQHGVDDVVRRNRAGAVRRRRPLLHDGVERHRVEAAACRQQQQVGQHAPTGRRLQDSGDGRQMQAGSMNDRCGEVPGEQGYPDRGKRNQMGADLAVQQTRAQHGADSDADREHGQQQGDHLTLGTQRVAGDGGEFGQQGGADRPKPAQAQDRQPDRAVAGGLTGDRRGFAQHVPADVQGAVGRGGGRNSECGSQAEQRDGDAGDGHDRWAVVKQSQCAAGHGAGENGEEGGGLDHAVAGDQFTVAQVVRQDAVFQRPEHGGLHPEAE